jgi:hypothetical protein
MQQLRRGLSQVNPRLQQRLFLPRTSPPRASISRSSSCQASALEPAHVPSVWGAWEAWEAWGDSTAAWAAAGDP